MRIFVTGASGFIGSAVLPELLSAGHEPVALARSENSAQALAASGVKVVRGSLDDLDVLRAAAADSDGVIHLAFKHDIGFSGDMEGAVRADVTAIEAMGEALQGSDRPLSIASGFAGFATNGPITEHDVPTTGPGAFLRARSADVTLALAASGVRSSVVRLSPTVHGKGDHGFVPQLISIARSQGVSGYVDDGANRWPAVHRLDAARLFRLAVESAPAGSVLHAAADEGVPARTIAEVIGRHLQVPVRSIPRGQAADHFGWIGAFFAIDIPASSTITQSLLGWEPREAGLVEDLDQGHYFEA